MTNALRQTVRVQPGGVIEIRSPELIPGTVAEVIVLLESHGEALPGSQPMTAADLLDSGLVGLWADRDDIGDSVEFARRLREQAERRGNET